MCEFEEKVRKSLIDCGVNLQGRLGVAVSGGADSVSLLLALSSFLSPLYVITINHNIRPAEESRGDVDFVLEVCEKLRRDGHEIICKTVELERGAVDTESKRRGGGTEDAARALRYEAFEKFIAENELFALCLAHNRNDQLETVLMRFLQGSTAQAAAGIRVQRGCFVRPLLDISRCEIEEYVTSRGFTWRTDKTNFETDYLRNKIRMKLIPFLDENFEGWKKAVLAGAEKAGEDALLINSWLEEIPLLPAEDGGVSLSSEDLDSAPDALKYRILLEACNRTGESSRIPYQFLKDVISAVEAASVSVPDSGFTKHFGSIDIIKEKNTLFVKKHAESTTDLNFSAIIEKTGTFEFPFGSLNVFNYREQNGNAFVSVRANQNDTDCDEGAVVDEVQFPFCVRNASPGDTVLCADGQEKKVSDVFSDWHVPAAKRSLVPVVQILNERPQRIKAVLGGFLGYKDWIVKL